MGAQSKVVTLQHCCLFVSYQKLGAQALHVHWHSKLTKHIHTTLQLSLIL